MVAGRRGVDETDYHHCSWTRRPPLPGGAIATPQVQSLTQELDRLQGAVQVLYRTGSQTDETLTDATGVSFRTSVSSSADQTQVFRPGQKIWAVDTSELPENSVTYDNVPDGHAGVAATPDQIRGAIIPSGPDNPLAQLGLKPQEDPGSYRIPRR
jgi:hypothetical protein